jgi:hypothetical protein
MGGDSNHCSKWVVMAVINSLCKKLDYLLAEIKENFLLAIGKLSDIGVISVAFKSFC